MSGETSSHHPYHLQNPHDFTHLETEYSVLPPELVEGYRQVETEASRAFLKHYGEYLSGGQKEYFSNNQILFTDHSTAEYFVNEWDEGIYTITPETVDDASIDDSVYAAYSVGEPPAEHAVTDHGGGSSTIQQSWAGRIVIHPLADNEILPISGEWLLDEDAFYERTDPLPASQAMKAIVPFIYSNDLASVAIHEKVHGAQDWRLPLPILEAAAHYYEREVAEQQSWHGREIAQPMQAMADFYGTCVEELGEDVHRLLFGTLDPEKRESMLSALKDRFTSDKIEQLSQSNHNQTVYWEKAPASKFKQD